MATTATTDTTAAPTAARASRLVRILCLASLLVAGAAGARLLAGPAVASYLAARAADVAEVERALDWDPSNPALHLRAAEARDAALGAAELGAARGHIEAALRLRPTRAGTWLRLAALSNHDGDLRRARAALDTALRLDPHNVAARWEAALLLLRWGENEAARRHILYVEAADPTRRAAARAVLAAMGDGRREPGQ